MSKRTPKEIANRIRQKEVSAMNAKELLFLYKYDNLSVEEKKRLISLRKQQKQVKEQKQNNSKNTHKNAVENSESLSDVLDIFTENYEDSNHDNSQDNTILNQQNKRNNIRGTLSQQDIDDNEKQTKIDELYIKKPQTTKDKLKNLGLKVIHNPVLIAAIVVIFAILFVFRFYSIPSESMYPTLKVNDRILGTAIYFPTCDSVDIGDVVCFYPPGNDTTVYVKRVIAKEGDRVQISGNTIYVNGEVSPYGDSGGLITSLDFVVDEGCLWMAGDNGTVSADSRIWGELPVDRLICKVNCIYWPISRATLL